MGVWGNCALIGAAAYTPRMPSADSLIERVREVALALPDAYEKLSHGAPTFFNRRGVFVMIAIHHHGSKHLSIWCNAPSGAQESLVAADPKHFFVPPYVGKSGWLGVHLDTGLRWPVVADLIAQAHATTDARKGSKRRKPAGR